MSFLTHLDKALAGWPDTALTWALVGLSLFGLVVAFFGKPSWKAAVLAYWLFP